MRKGRRREKEKCKTKKILKKGILRRKIVCRLGLKGGGGGVKKERRA